MPTCARLTEMQTENSNVPLKFPRKSTVEEIRVRFDQEVERFSNLQTGQQATIDAALSLALIAESAARVTPRATALLDVGCGAGNYSLMVLERLPHLDVTLVDLSGAMLDRAVARVSRATTGKVTARQGDIRELNIGESSFDLICAAAVLHHLREAAEWQSVFARFHAALRLGGSFWVADLIEHSDPGVQALMWGRYGDYLTRLKNEAYRDEVFAYITQEDTPRPLMFQLDLLRAVGFRDVEILHKNSCFAAFGGIKRG
jgi:tRNA (cmo5U34)-methyltransferase